MEEVVSPENYGKALKAVIANEGAPGIDGMSRMRCEPRKGMPRKATIGSWIWNHQILRSRQLGHACVRAAS